MPGSEEFSQTAVHALEAGGLAVWVRRGAVALGIIAIASIYLYQFRGLSTSQGMDQALIGRAIARGEGWSTKLVRPRAVRQLQTHGRSVSEKIWTDTYDAPLPPFVDAIALLLVKPYWKITPRTLIYAGDRYGLAYLLVHWNRLALDIPFARIGFITLLYFLCALPMIFATPWLPPPKPFVRWPPYMPALIGVLNDWMKPEEIIASDMPRAVASYADWRSLWLPETIRVFTDYSDYSVLGGPVNGLYLTPLSGPDNKLRDIVKGEYNDWASVIQRTQILEKFPLKWNTVALGLDSECIFLSDRDRSKPPTSP